MRQENPDSSVGEVAKELGRRWNEVGDDVKGKYEGLAAKDKARYEKASCTTVILVHCTCMFWGALAVTKCPA